MKWKTGDHVRAGLGTWRVADRVHARGAWRYVIEPIDEAAHASLRQRPGPRILRGTSLYPADRRASGGRA